MIKIPKSFKLFGTTINVVVDTTKMNNDNRLGECSFYEAKITLGDTIRSNKINEEVMMDTFYHEKVHLILDSMNKNELSSDEDFVEVFSRLLRQSDVTAKYK